MSQEFANLCTDASPQPQDLNLRIRLVKNGSDWARITPAPSPRLNGSLSRAPKRLADGISTASKVLKPFRLPLAQHELRQDTGLALYTPVPLPANFVSRKRLLDKLSADNYPFIQIVAPAGYGKSSLVNEWLKEKRRQSTWLALSNKDNNPNQFWMNLVKAIDVALPGSGASAQQLLSSSVAPTIQTLLTVLCRDLYRAAQQHNRVPVVLVIDNYQVINSTAIHARLLDLINLLPKQLQMVILSRQELPFEESRIHPPHIALTQKELAFTTLETSEFFKKSTARPSIIANAIEIAEYAEGWPVGLNLIASKIEEQPNQLNEILFLKSRKPLVSALMTETFCSIHPTLQVFMLCTSLLNRFTPDLCDSLFTGELHSLMFGKSTQSNSDEPGEFKNSREMIEYLEKSGQFITQCSEGAEWRRYHPMFAEMLRAELRERCPELELILRDRSQIWYLRQECSAAKKSEHGQNIDHCNSR